MEELKVDIDGKQHTVKIEESGNKLKVYLEGKTYEVETSLKEEQKDYDIKDSSSEDASGTIKAHLPGVIFSIDVKKGDKVNKGQKLISLVAMKMENQIISPKKGVVKEINVKTDQKVNKNDTLMVIE